ncbi:MAG: DUF5362 family protein [Ferruginibacter sp.]
MESNQNLLNAELQIDSIAHAHLSETAKWANFLSIVGFVLSGIIAVIALFAGTILGSLTNSYGGGTSFIGAGFIMVIYLIFAALYFFMSLYLYRFASKMKAALYTNDQESLNNSFLNLKNMYKLMGILTIVYLSFMVLAIIIGIAGAAFMR